MKMIVDRSSLLTRLADIESMGQHAPAAIRELIEELGGFEDDDPKVIYVEPCKEPQPWWRRSLWP